MTKRKLPAQTGKESAPNHPKSEPDTDDLGMLRADQIESKKLDWLWEDALEFGTVAFLQGKKSAGKSTWLRAIAAYATGGPLLPRMTGRRRFVGNVLYFAGEQNLEKIVKPGLIAAGANMTKILMSDRRGGGGRPLRLVEDCDRLRRLIQSFGARLVIVDPIFSFLDDLADIEGSSTGSRRFMGELQDLAEDTGAHLLLSRNCIKGLAKSAVDSGRGGGELGNAARSVMHVQNLPTNDGYGLAMAATNHGSPPATITYRFQPKKGAVILDVYGEADITADELASGEDGSIDRRQIADAKSVIRQMLQNSELDSRFVKEVGARCMIGERTMQRAAVALNVTQRREGNGAGTKVFWGPPREGWPTPVVPEQAEPKPKPNKKPRKKAV